MKTRSMHKKMKTVNFDSLDNHTIKKKRVKLVETPERPIVKQIPHTPKKVRPENIFKRFAKPVSISKVIMMYVDGQYSSSFTDDEGLFDDDIHVNIMTTEYDDFNIENRFPENNICRCLQF